MSVRGDVQSCLAAVKRQRQRRVMLQPHAVIFISSMSNTTNRERERVHVGASVSV